MLSWIVGIVLVLFGVFASVVIYFGEIMGSETGEMISAWNDLVEPMLLWGGIPALVGLAVIYWR